MKFGDAPSNNLDMHAAREVLKDERDRQMRVLQDDDRKRGLLSGGTANASLRLPEDLLREEEMNNNRQNYMQQQGGYQSSSPKPGKPRNTVVSGASQLIGARESSPHDIFNRADTVLCVVTFVSAVNPSRSWTFPATSHLWNQLENSALVPICNPPVPLHRTIVASSTHTQRTLSLLTEYVRDVMLAQTECTTSILCGPQIHHSDRVFWTTWDPSVLVDPDEQEAENLAAAEAPYEPNLPSSMNAFPGELLQPAPSLVGKTWPSQGQRQANPGNESNQQEQNLEDDDF